MASYMGHEYTPAEQGGRYRVGDRVRVVKDGDDNGGSYHGADIGSVDTIIAVDSDNGVPYEGKEWFYKNHEVSPAFRPGDRVKLNRHRDLYACGDRGTVKRVFGDNVEVSMDLRSVFASRSYVFPAEYLDWERAEDVQASEPKASAPDCAVRKVEQDNEVTLGDILAKALEPKPKFKAKFKAGDTVKHINGETNYTINDVRADGWILLNGYEGQGYWDTKWFHAAATVSQSAIVALTKNGKPLPSRYPHVHPSVDAATQEAERLARINPGEEFAVYQRVTARVCEATYSMKEVA